MNINGREKGFRHSPETIEKMRQTNLQTWARFTMVKVPREDEDAVKRFLADRKSQREENQLGEETN